MTKEVTTRSSEPSLPQEIKVYSNKDINKAQSLAGGLVSIAYFESLMSDGVSARVTFNDTGTSKGGDCLLYTSPSPRDATLSRMPSSA